MIRILIVGAVILLAMSIASCSPASDETSTSDAAIVAEGTTGSESAEEPTIAPTHTATSEPTIEPTSTSEPTPEPTATSEPTQEPTATPDIQMYLDLDLPEGNPLNGKVQAIRNGCRGCHFNEESEGFAISFAAVDGLPPILKRGEMRIADPGYTGKATSNLEYIFDSIYLPEAYVVEGEWVEEMPLSFNFRLTDPQDLADILAWMAALNDPDFEQ